MIPVICKTIFLSAFDKKCKDFPVSSACIIDIVWGESAIIFFSEVM